MNPYLLILACVAQVCILHVRSPWETGLAGGLGACAVFGLFAFTRFRWDAHLDMYLAMMSWGGLGMMLPQLLTGASCHHSFDWSQYGLMSFSMWTFSLVPIWRESRCIEAARAQGREWGLLLMDAVGMQLGMGLAHLPLLWMPMGDARVEWFAQVSMLMGMGLGMMGAQHFYAGWERQDIAAMG